MSSKGTIQVSEADQNHIFYNAYLFNPDPVNSTLCYFQDNRSQAILENADDFVCSVIRFAIPSSNIPICFFDNYAYSVGFGYNGSTYTASLNYVSNGYPQINGKQPVWSVDQFLRSVNAAFATACSSLTTANPSLASTITFAPYVLYNDQTQLFSMNAAINPFDNVLYPSGVQILMNVLLWTKFFITFETVYSQTTNYEQIYMASSYGQNVVNGILSVQTDVECVGNWSDLQQLVLVSSNLPTRSEFIPPPLNAAGSSLNLQLKQISDFEPAADATDAIDALAYNYLPTGQYRWIDLVGNGKVSTIDVQAYWRSKAGDLYPIYLLPKEVFTMKMLFVAKRLLKGETDNLTFSDVPTQQQSQPALAGSKRGRPRKNVVKMREI